MSAGISTEFDGQTIYIGRQPIFDTRLDVYAYELLYRDGEGNVAEIAEGDGDRATAEVVANAFVEMGIAQVSSGKPVFINLTEGFIEQGLTHLFPPEQVVAEILEEVDASESVVAKVKELKDAGYLIALDDFVFRENLAGLVRQADIIKLDIMALGQEGFAEQVKLLAPFGKILLAEKVETQEEFDFCKKHGCRYFQGYFLSRPRTIKSRGSNQSFGLVQLLSLINDPTTTTDELEAHIANDAALSYKLIQFINSASFAVAVPIESIQHAIRLLGDRTVRTWATFVIMFSIPARSPEILKSAMIRARMSQLLAEYRGTKNAEAYFTAGLFSALDALFDSELEVLLSSLCISDELKSSLLHHEGKIGQVLACVLNYEKADWDDCDNQVWPVSFLNQSYIAAIAWAEEALAQPNKEEANDKGEDSE